VPEGTRAVEQTSMRRMIARRMSESKQRIPHFYVATEVEMDASLSALSALNADRTREERVTVTALLVRALAATLVEHPAFNAVWDGDVLRRSDVVNIAVAIELTDGLLAPALLGCEAMDLSSTTTELRSLLARAKAGRIRAAEWSEATFTLTNLGMFDIAHFTAIIVPPQVAILATGRIEPRAVVRNGQIVVRRLMTATLSADHRAVDGATAARFLGTLNGRLQDPDTWIAQLPARAPA